MITVILTAYNRPETLKAQIASIENQTVKPKEIWIWYNKGDREQIKIDNENIKVIYASHNFKFHGRFSLALLAQTEYIAIFDDDCLPQPRWFENCINTIKQYNGILGTSGVTLLGKKYRPNIKYGWTSNHNESTVQVDLVGHNWFFKKEWLKYMWMEEPVSWENGEDIQFSALCQKYGNINTYVPPHPIKDKSLWGNNIEHATKWGNDKNATHLSKKNHYPLRDSICEAYIKKGWKTINNK